MPRIYDIRNWTDEQLLSAAKEYSFHQVDEEIQRRKNAGIWKLTKEL